MSRIPTFLKILHPGHRSARPCNRINYQAVSDERDGGHEGKDALDCDSGVSWQPDESSCEAFAYSSSPHGPHYDNLSDQSCNKITMNMRPHSVEHAALKPLSDGACTIGRMSTDIKLIMVLWQPQVGPIISVDIRVGAYLDLHVRFDCSASPQLNRALRFREHSRRPKATSATSIRAAVSEKTPSS